VLASLLRRFEEPLRFVIVGGINTLVGYSMFALLLWLLGTPLSGLESSDFAPLRLAGTHFYAVIQWMNWILCVPFSTFMMRRFVFKKDGSFPRQVLRAYGIYLPAQIIAFIVLIVTVTFAGLPPLVGQAISIVFSGLFSYLGHKFFTFRS